MRCFIFAKGMITKNRLLVLALKAVAIGFSFQSLINSSIFFLTNLFARALQGGGNATAKQSNKFKDGRLQFLLSPVLLVSSWSATMAFEDILWEEEAHLKVLPQEVQKSSCRLFSFRHFVYFIRSERTKLLFCESSTNLLLLSIVLHNFMKF